MEPGALLVLALDVGFTVRVDVDVKRHRVAADRAVFDVVLVSAGRDIHRDNDFFAARVADVRGFEIGGGPSSAAFFSGLLHGGHAPEGAAGIRR